MKNNIAVTTVHKSSLKKSIALPEKKDIPTKINEDRVKSKSACSKLMALHDALQDPVTGCEGI